MRVCKVLFCSDTEWGFFLCLVSVLDTDANRILRIENTEAVCDREQESSTEISIDDELDKLPAPQREYLKKAFINMIQTIPAMS